MSNPVVGGQTIKFNMAVELEDLITCGEMEGEGIVGLNNLADDNNPYFGGFILSDMSYRVIGYKAGDDKGTVSGSVYIEVTAVLEEI